MASSSGSNTTKEGIQDTSLFAIYVFMDLLLLGRFFYG